MEDNEIKIDENDNTEENEDSEDSLLPNENEIKLPNDKNNYIFIFSIYLIHALIAMGFYFICYKYNFVIEMYSSDITIENTFWETNLDNIKAILYLFSNRIFIYTFIGIFTLLGSIYILSTPDKSCKSKKCETIINYALFILLNIYKLVLKIFIYLFIIVKKNNNETDFYHFEARMYWKASMCFSILIFIFYCYFRNNERPTKKAYALISILGLIVIIVLCIITKKSNNNPQDSGRNIQYPLFYVFEVVLLYIAIFNEEKFYKNYRIVGVELNWRIHRIDGCFYLIIPFIYFGKALLYIIKLLYICWKMEG